LPPAGSTKSDKLMKTSASGEVVSHGSRQGAATEWEAPFASCGSDFIQEALTLGNGTYFGERAMKQKGGVEGSRGSNAATLPALAFRVTVSAE
jgi:hypothetical protein